MKLVMQPSGSYLCGQACVAMIAEISLDDSISVFGKHGETPTRDVIAALRKLRISCGNKLTRMKKGISLPPCCILVLHFDGVPIHIWHWVVYYNGLYYDPGEGIGIGYKDETRITSYLPVCLDEKCQMEANHECNDSRGSGKNIENHIHCA